MKKIILSSVFMMAAWMAANAMSFSRAQQEALYLTDKMAYELNLNDQQYNDVYEINLDYFLNIDSPSDLDGVYYDYRLNDLRCILHDWQYSLLFATDYFLRPILWRATGWYFPIYSYYNRNYFYYRRPSVWVSYRGGHSRHYHHSGFYTHRRPVWNGGLRGREMHHSSVGSHRSGVGSHRSGGNGYHIDMSGHRGGRVGQDGHNGGNHSGMNHGSMSPGRSTNHGNMNHGSMNPGRSTNHGSMSPGRSSGRGNSFDGSSSRMSGGSRGHSMNQSGSHSFGGRSSSHSGGGTRSGGGGGGSRGGRR